MSQRAVVRPEDRSCQQLEYNRLAPEQACAQLSNHGRVKLNLNCVSYVKKLSSLNCNNNNREKIYLKIFLLQEAYLWKVTRKKNLELEIYEKTH